MRTHTYALLVAGVLALVTLVAGWNREHAAEPTHLNPAEIHRPKEIRPPRASPRPSSAPKRAPRSRMINGEELCQTSAQAENRPNSGKGERHV